MPSRITPSVPLSSRSPTRAPGCTAGLLARGSRRSAAFPGRSPVASGEALAAHSRGGGRGRRAPGWVARLPRSRVRPPVWDGAGATVRLTRGRARARGQGRRLWGGARSRRAAFAPGPFSQNRSQRRSSSAWVGQASAGRPRRACSARTVCRVGSPRMPSTPPTSWPRALRGRPRRGRPRGPSRRRRRGGGRGRGTWRSPAGGRRGIMGRGRDVATDRAAQGRGAPRGRGTILVSGGRPFRAPSPVRRSSRMGSAGWPEVPGPAEGRDDPPAP